MITQALATATARELEHELRARRISSRELLDAYLLRIEQLDPPINSVVTIDRERAYAAASKADDAAARGDWLGPLHACRSPSKTLSRWPACARPAEPPS